MIDVPTVRDVQLLGVRYLVVPTGVALAAAGQRRRAGPGLRPRRGAGVAPRVSVVPAWTVVTTKTAALAAVLAPGFDPVRRRGGIRPGRIQQPARHPAGHEDRDDAGSDRRRGRRRGPSIVVVRTTFDEGWAATVDGEPADVLPTDGFLLGIPVDAGAHEIRLTYRDPSIGRGLAAGPSPGSRCWSRPDTVVRERRRSRSAPPPDSPVPSSDGAGR